MIFASLFLSAIFFMKSAGAVELDRDLLNSLKIEAGHDLNRLKSLDEEQKNRKIYDNEREKSLGQYLEEQEKWDLQREKGIAEFKKSKKSHSPSDDGPEFKEDQILKQKAAVIVDKNREIFARTRNQFLQKNTDIIAQYESHEFGLQGLRPRYDLRKRGLNKWVKSGATAKPSPGGFTPSSNDSDNGFPPPPPADFIPAPPPTDSYEEIPPPPPPPPNFDYSGGSTIPYDAGFGDIPPPPPPPPPDYDF
jgi:hypothetical protein